MWNIEHCSTCSRFKGSILGSLWDAIWICFVCQERIEEELKGESSDT